MKQFCACCDMSRGVTYAFSVQWDSDVMSSKPVSFSVTKKSWGKNRGHTHSRK